LPPCQSAVALLTINKGNGTDCSIKMVRLAP
jgi:hypothetical protein